VAVPQIQTSQPVPSVDKIPTAYREAKKDPFLLEKIEKPVVGTPAIINPVANIIAPPSFEQRDAAWREARSGRGSHNAEPSILEKYLVSEVKVLGLYQKPEGQGVFLKPTITNGTTIFAMVGQKFWNGEIKTIYKDKIEVEVTTLISTGTRTEKRKEIQTIPFTRIK
jgi:hypothetical protein